MVRLRDLPAPVPAAAPARRSRRTWLIAGIGVFVLAGIVIALMSALSSMTQSSPASKLASLVRWRRDSMSAASSGSVLRVLASRLQGGLIISFGADSAAGQ
jgi:hypothetical protein